MKLAVLYSGLPRYINLVFYNHSPTFLRGLDIDYYYHFWSTHGFTPGWQHIAEPTSQDILTTDERATLQDLLHPAAYQYDDLIEQRHQQAPLVAQIKAHPEWQPTWSNPDNYVSQYYSIAQAFRLLEQSGNSYDVVIRLRTDLLFSPTASNQFTLDDCLHSPDGDGFGVFGIDDHCEYGSQSTMKIYAGVHGSLQHYRPHPELSVVAHMQANNVGIRKDWHNGYTVIRLTTPSHTVSMMPKQASSSPVQPRS